MGSNYNHIVLALMGMFATLSVIDIKIILGLASGTILQFIFSAVRNIKTFIFIAFTSIFVGYLVLTPLMDYAGVPPQSSIRIMVLSLSALISVEIVRLIIRLLPQALRSKAEQVLDLTSDEKKGGL